MCEVSASTTVTCHNWASGLFWQPFAVVRVINSGNPNADSTSSSTRALEVQEMSSERLSLFAVLLRIAASR